MEVIRGASVLSEARFMVLSSTPAILGQFLIVKNEEQISGVIA